MAADYEEQISQLNEEIENIQRDYDEQLIMIANDKQQVSIINLHLMQQIIRSFSV